jgi:hypothetical protein
MVATRSVTVLATDAEQMEVLSVVPCIVRVVPRKFWIETTDVGLTIANGVALGAVAGFTSGGVAAAKSVLVGRLIMVDPVLSEVYAVGSSFPIFQNVVVAVSTAGGAFVCGLTADCSC